MTWLQLRLDTDKSEAPALEDWLLENGASAVTLQDNADQPVLEPGVGETPLWQATRVTGLFTADTAMEPILDRLPEDVRQRCHAKVEVLEDKDWEREWMQHYQPVCFGDTLWVCPSWLEPPEPEAVTLLLDPGLAFGTGTHPTTALCLTELTKLNLTNKAIVDYGCGSGILAVAALKLGANHALCVDNDPQALTATLDNAGRNKQAISATTVALPNDIDWSSHLGQADVVIANILAEPLMKLSDSLLALLAPNGTLLLSGLLATQAEMLIEHYRPRIALEVCGEHEGWVCLRGEFLLAQQ